MKFKSDIEVQAGLRDSSNAIGTSGQVLLSTGSAVIWVNQNEIAVTLNDVLTNGNTSLLDAKVRTLGLWDVGNSYYNKIGSIGNAFYFMRNDGAALFVTEAGYSRFSTDYGTLELSNAGIIGSKTINWPDASGTVALTSDIPANQNLQSVTDEGNITTNSIFINELNLYDGSNDQYANIKAGEESFIFTSTATWNASFQFDFSNITGLPFKTYNLPFSDGTLALTSDIPSLTSELTNDGADGVNPFITALDIPTFASADKMVTVGRNATGSTLYKGTIIYISGSTGNRPNFVKSIASGEGTSAGTFGVIENDIPNNTDGNCVTLGTIDNLDTRSVATHPFTADTLVDGDTIYLSPTTAGYITNVKPSAPNHLVYVGKVVRTSPTNGTIVYRIQNGYELDELHDVSIVSKTNNDILQYDSTTSLWKNRSLSTAGIQPTLTPAALTKVNDTNVTLTLGGTPTTSLLQSVSLTLGWTGTLADGRIASAATWTAKQDAITGAATTITTSNLTASRVLVSDASGKVAANTVTTTTLGYLDATSSIQTQLNGKQGSLTLTTTGSSGAATLVGNTLNIPQYSGGGGGSTPVKLTSQTLIAASWTLAGAYYTYAFSNVNVDTTSDVSVTPQNASYLTAYNAQVLPFVGVAAGVATFYSQFPPEANIIVDIVITQTA